MFSGGTDAGSHSEQRGEQGHVVELSWLAAETATGSSAASVVARNWLEPSQKRPQSLGRNRAKNALRTLKLRVFQDFGRVNQIRDGQARSTQIKLGQFKLRSFS